MPFLILRQNKLEPLTWLEMDNNLTYLEQLAQQGGGTVSPEFFSGEITVPMVKISNLYEEELNVDFENPITEPISVDFTGIKNETELIEEGQFGESEEGIVEVKIKTTSLIGQVKSTIIYDLFFDDTEEEEEEENGFSEFFEFLFSSQLTFDYKLTELYVKPENDFILIYRLLYFNLKGNIIIEDNVGVELSQYYYFDSDNNSSRHKFKFSEIGFSRKTFINDWPSILKAEISNTGNILEKPLLLDFNDLPKENELNSINEGMLYESNDGTIKIKRNNE